MGLLLLLFAHDFHSSIIIWLNWHRFLQKIWWWPCWYIYCPYSTRLLWLKTRKNIGLREKVSFCRFRGGPSITHGGPLISVAAVLHKKWLTQVVFLKFEIMGALRFAARQNLQKIESTEWENQHLSLSIQVWCWKGFNPISTSIHPYP